MSEIGSRVELCHLNPGLSLTWSDVGCIAFEEGLATDETVGKVVALLKSDLWGYAYLENIAVEAETTDPPTMPCPWQAIGKSLHHYDP